MMVPGIKTFLIGIKTMYKYKILIFLYYIMKIINMWETIENGLYVAIRI